MRPPGYEPGELPTAPPRDISDSSGTRTHAPQIKSLLLYLLSYEARCPTSQLEIESLRAFMFEYYCHIGCKDTGNIPDRKIIWRKFL